MQKQEFVNLLKDNNIVNLSTTTDSAVAAVAPIVTQLRQGGFKGKQLADWAVEAGVSKKSATSLISDFHAVGSYLKDYPDKAASLTEEHQEKIWRKMFLCPARRVHRLKKGSTAERDAKAEVLQRHGRASLQVATALKTWQDNAQEVSEALDVLKTTHYREKPQVPVEEDTKISINHVVSSNPESEFVDQEGPQDYKDGEIAVQVVESLNVVKSRKVSRKPK